MTQQQQQPAPVAPPRRGGSLFLFILISTVLWMTFLSATGRPVAGSTDPGGFTKTCTEQSAQLTAVVTASGLVVPQTTGFSVLGSNGDGPYVKTVSSLGGCDIAYYATTTTTAPASVASTLTSKGWTVTSRMPVRASRTVNDQPWVVTVSEPDGTGVQNVTFTPEG